MVDHAFEFELNLTDAGRRHAMLEEVTARLLAFVGYQERRGRDPRHVQAAIASACRGMRRLHAALPGCLGTTRRRHLAPGRSRMAHHTAAALSV